MALYERLMGQEEPKLVSVHAFLAAMQEYALDNKTRLGV